MTIEWRKTAGGVEIAEHEDMTCVVKPCGYLEVYVDGKLINYTGQYSRDGAKQWFEREYCQPKYTVTKYGDGGEVYASNDGKRVAMCFRSRTSGLWNVVAGDAMWADGLRGHDHMAKSAIAYVTGKDS